MCEKQKEKERVTFQKEQKDKFQDVCLRGEVLFAMIYREIKESVFEFRACV